MINYVTQIMSTSNASFTSKRRHDLATLEVLDGGEYLNFMEYLHVSHFKSKPPGLFPENGREILFSSSSLHPDFSGEHPASHQKGTGHFRLA